MNLFNMAKDLKGMEKMMKPALEKFMKDSGFVKKEELTKLENRIKELEDRLNKIWLYLFFVEMFDSKIFSPSFFPNNASKPLPKTFFLPFTIYCNFIFWN